MKKIFTIIFLIAVACSPPPPIKRIILPVGWAERTDTLICISKPLLRSLLDTFTFNKLRYDDFIRLEKDKDVP
jgi:hypothetical protein